MSEVGVRDARAEATERLGSSAGQSGVESAFAGVMPGREIVAFAYARRALMEVLEGIGVPLGGEVVLSPLTCKVVPLAIFAGGWRPRFVDIDPATLNLDSTRLAEHLSAHRTGAVLFQHTYGLDGGADDIARATTRVGVPLVEDCCHCVPLHRPGWKPGTRGRAALFSNNLLKPLPAAAGALVTTEDPDLADRLRTRREAYREPGTREVFGLRASFVADRAFLWPRTYWWLYDAYHGARGSARARPLRQEIEREIEPTARQLSAFEVDRARTGVRALPSVDRHRTACVDRYRAELSEVGRVETPATRAATPLFFFPILVPDKQDLIRAAKRHRVEIVAWPNRTVVSGVEDPDGLRTIGYEGGSCPEAEDVARRLVGLPTHTRITEAHLERTVGLVRERYHG